MLSVIRQLGHCPGVPAARLAVLSARATADDARLADAQPAPRSYQRRKIIRIDADGSEREYPNANRAAVLLGLLGCNHNLSRAANLNGGWAHSANWAWSDAPRELRRLREPHEPRNIARHYAYEGTRANREKWRRRKAKGKT